MSMLRISVDYKRTCYKDKADKRDSERMQKMFIYDYTGCAR